MIASACLLAGGVAACSGSREVTVRVSIDGPDSADVALQGVTVVAVPYDRDSIVAELERRGSPRPHTATLDSLYASFRAPFTEFAAATAALDAARDSAARGLVPPARVAAAEAAVERIRPLLDRARTDLSGRGDSLRLAIRAWEDSTYEGYDSLAKERSRVRKPIADTTDAAGLATFSLGAGDWWVTATSWDAGDPNAIWYWNEKILDDTVRLDARNAVHRPRY